jgi:hypothetical protein
MEASWVATEPGSGRISAFRYSGVGDYISRMEDLLKLGEGYSEVSCRDQLYPRVILAFRASYGVVAHWSPAGETQLLLGDGIISNDTSVSLPELEGDTEYTGELFQVGSALGMRSSSLSDRVQLMESVNGLGCEASVTRVYGSGRRRVRQWIAVCRRRQGEFVRLRVVNS